MSRKVSKIWSISDEELKKIVQDSLSLGDVLDYLGYSRASGAMAKMLKERLSKSCISTLHFKPFARNNQKSIYNLSEILVDNSKYTNINSLKKRLLKEKVLEYKCAGCGNVGVWNGQSLKLQLHHKNGKHLDHRVENICFLCPNCHSQTENYSGKNNGSYKSAT